MGARTHILLAACVVTVMGAGCKPRSIVGMHCEGGVKTTGKKGIEGYDGQGGECLYVVAKEDATNAASIGTATWVSAFTQPLTVRRAGKSSYTLHSNGERVGTIEQDGVWLTVVFQTALPGSHIQVNNRYMLRSDIPGPFI